MILQVARLNNQSKHMLSEQQKRILCADIALVEACPGAGKTRAVIARFMQETAGHQRSGIALLSFTNIAADEIASRCNGIPHALRPPHFVGTFDTFVHRYIITPSKYRAGHKTITFLRSWDDFSYEWQYIKRHKSQSGGISLSCFTIAEDGTIGLRQSGIKEDFKRYLTELQTKSLSDYNELLANCVSDIEGYNSAGKFDSDTARFEALKILRNDKKAITRLKQRFNEIIVDEFQDCAKIEHEILSILANAGIKILTVADPDQAIFGFRNATGNLYATYRAKLPTDKIVSFTENYRSTQAICDLVSSMRSSGKITSKADVQTPELIYIVSESTKSKSLNKALGIFASHGIPANKMIVVARTNAEARALAGNRKIKHSVKLAVKILDVLLGLEAGAVQGKNAHTSLMAAEKRYLAIFNWGSSAQTLSTNELYILLGKDRIWFRRMLLQLKKASSSWSTVDDYKKDLRQIIQSETEGLPVPLTNSIPKLTLITAADWNNYIETKNQLQGTMSVKWSSIHGVKGGEYAGVLLHAPAPEAMADWNNDLDTEERRLLYVAASRAQKVLVMHIQPSRESELIEVLKDKGISYSVA